MDWTAMRRLAAGVLTVGLTVGAAAPSGSDLRVVRLDPAPAPPGGSTTVHGFVANDGPGTTAAPFTVVLDVPRGFSFQNGYFPADCRPGALGHVLQCTFPPGLKSGRSATVLAPVLVDANVPPGTRAEGHVRVVSAAGDPTPDDDWTPFTLTVSRD